jgi:hypothetical protein
VGGTCSPPPPANLNPHQNRRAPPGSAGGLGCCRRCRPRLTAALGTGGA